MLRITLLTSVLLILTSARAQTDDDLVRTITINGTPHTVGTIEAQARTEDDRTIYEMKFYSERQDEQAFMVEIHLTDVAAGIVADYAVECGEDAGDRVILWTGFSTHPFGGTFFDRSLDSRACDVLAVDARNELRIARARRYEATASGFSGTGSAARGSFIDLEGRLFILDPETAVRSTIDLDLRDVGVFF